MKPTIPEVLPEFAAYYKENPIWGSLHIVLDDANVADSDVDFCIEDATRRGDVEGERLARILRTMSRTQRLRLPRIVSDYSLEHWGTP